MENKQIRSALSPVEYWEWRTTIAEMEVEKNKLLRTELEFKLLNKEAEILAVRQQLFLRTRMDAAKTTYSNFKQEYERFKGVLEEALGQSLNNKVIDDITFEIKELPDENKKPQETPAKKE